MVAYGEYAFDEKKVTNIRVKDYYDSRKRYWKSEVTIVLFVAANKYDFITFETVTHNEAISKMNEITKLINDREELLLKLKAE